MILTDGSGKNYDAKVDRFYRLHVDAVTRFQDGQAALQSNSYNINTGSINLTSANESAILYIKNNETLPLIIKEIIIIAGSSTNGTGDATITITKNPSTGTIISGASAVETNSNRDFGSTKSLTADVYKGAEGNTITNGTSFASTTRSTFTAPINFDASIIVLRQGNSISVEFTPPSGNTSQNVRVAVVAFIENADLTSDS